MLLCSCCRVALADQPGLLIIAPRALVPGLAEFVAFKGGRLPTTLVPLEDALAAGDDLGPCVDDAERLKRWLYREWAVGRAGAEADGEPGVEGGIGYVLLVGDADVLPVRYMTLDRNTEAAFNYAFYPSDLYYADVADDQGAFEDWNGQREGFHASCFGEVQGEHNKDGPINFDGVDYRPDIALGRWPVSTREQLEIVVEKTMAYERAVEQGEVPARAGMIAVGGWVPIQGQMERWASSLPEGWSVERRYDPEGGVGTPIAPREAEVLDLLNLGMGLIIHAGHGSDDAWHASIGSGTIARMTNSGITPIMISCGCSTARFATLPPYEGYEDVQGVSHIGTDAGEVFGEPPPPPACYARGAFNKSGFGERLLRDGPNGAVAYIGCNTGSQPCGLSIAEGFVRTLAERTRLIGEPGPGREAAEGGAARCVRLGDCWVGAISYYYDAQGLATIEPSESWYPASIFFQGMKFMLFGDPSVPMPRVE